MVAMAAVDYLQTQAAEAGYQRQLGVESLRDGLEGLSLLDDQPLPDTRFASADPAKIKIPVKEAWKWASDWKVEGPSPGFKYGEGHRGALVHRPTGLNIRLDYHSH